MGSSNSCEMENLGALGDWVSERACGDTTYSAEFRHLSYYEKTEIEQTIVRAMATNRRIETKILQLARDDEHVLDALSW